jgi:hypothetical protein
MAALPCGTAKTGRGPHGGRGEARTFSPRAYQDVPVLLSYPFCYLRCGTLPGARTAGDSPGPGCQPPTCLASSKPFFSTPLKATCQLGNQASEFLLWPSGLATLCPDSSPLAWLSLVHQVSV